MEPKKKSLWNFLNPLAWMDAIFGSLLRFFGLMPRPRTDGFENISPADVEDAERVARETEEAIDDIMEQMSPAEVVHAYAAATPEDRALMDLSAIDDEGKDWLLGLSDDDLTLLATSNLRGCARSLEAREVKPAYPRCKPESEAPEVLKIPSAEDEDEIRRRYVAERFRQVERELWLSSGVPNPKPQHATATLY